MGRFVTVVLITYIPIPGLFANRYITTAPCRLSTCGDWTTRATPTHLSRATSPLLLSRLPLDACRLVRPHAGLLVLLTGVLHCVSNCAPLYSDRRQRTALAWSNQAKSPRRPAAATLVASTPVSTQGPPPLELPRFFHARWRFFGHPPVMPALLRSLPVCRWLPRRWSTV